MSKFHRAMSAVLSCLAVVLLAACASAASPRSAAPDPQLTAAVADPLRAASNRARDGARHPYETLHAFGLQPDWTVVEIAPGGGWYTEILAPYLRAQGHYVAALYVEDAATPAETQAQVAQARERFEAKFGRDPARYGQIAVGTLRNQGLAGVGAPASADAVLTFRNIHNWIEGGHFDSALHSFFDVLKPGGVLGVEEHRAPAGTPLDRIIATGYVPEDYVIAHAKMAGFELVSRSEANANPRDTKNHPNGVWSLPPTLRGGAVDRDRFLAIGESDRMTLTFVKPKR
jgi:predicted methyltransferase